MPSLSGPLVLFLFQSPSFGSPIPILIFVLSILGAVTDWQYKKAGGKPSGRRDKIIFSLVVLIVAVTIAVLLYLGYNPEILGMIIVPLALWLFFGWEVGRWRMRRKYPLPKPESPQPKPPDSKS
jgi:hypothetical protein